MGSPRLALLPAAGLSDELRQLAARLDLPLLESAVDPAACVDFDALLVSDRNGLSLQRTGPGAPGPVSVDFGSASMRHRRGAGHNELLGRAVGAGGKASPCVLDATAGLGRDSFVLADLGCRVLMCEREPVVAALLTSGLERARGSGDPWLREVVGRMALRQGDARELVAGELDPVEVIYLDPMFPARHKSAAVKKEMALFQLLLEGQREDADIEGLLHWALQQDVARVVVKRPVRGEPMAGRSPSHAITGKAVRYDVYVKRGFA